MTSGIDVDAFVAYEATGFDRVADTYNRRLAPLTGRLADPLLDAAGVRRDERDEQDQRVLDVATGPGQVAERAAARGASVVGVDVSPGVVDLARRLHPGIEFRVGDAHRLPVDDAAFDAVVAGFLLPHLADHPRATAEMVRVLAAGGRLAMSTWDLPQRSPMPGVLFLAVEQSGAPPAEGIPPGPPFYRYADDTLLTALLADAGLVDVEVHVVELSWRAPSAGAAWDALMEGTVRASAQVRGQSPTMQQRIRTAFDDLVAPHRIAGGAEIDLPVRVKIAAGRKP